MENFLEIDFIQIDSDGSGDAIPIRYKRNDITTIHLVDAGYKSTGQQIIDYINENYGNPKIIDAVIITHPDQDHLGGIITVLESFDVKSIWMNRPWLYASELLGKFKRFRTVDGLEKHLRKAYPKLDKIEKHADSQSIPIYAPFQGEKIGEFTVLSPTKKFYLSQVLKSDKTADIHESSLLKSLTEKLAAVIKSALWGEEHFPSEGTAPENQMSVIQYLDFDGHSFLLTGDAGREAFKIASEYALSIGITLPMKGKFQVPHHGSRRNVNIEMLDTWLGPKQRRNDPNRRGTAVISASDKDKDHPKKVVIRACFHRGYPVITTEYGSKRVGVNAPNRSGWSTANPVKYPEEMED